MIARFCSSILLIVLAGLPALAQVRSCSEPLQYCSSTDSGNVSVEPCSVTCADGVKAVCVQGELAESAGKRPCIVKSENQCYCSGDERNVQTLGDHE